jgi:hypothetical protein
MRKFVAFHVCAECGKSHCGCCPDNDIYTIETIVDNVMGFGVTDDDLTNLIGVCDSHGPWPVVIGTGFIEI